jgi:N-acetylated-alpha-linked acidic dipeptidase
MPARRPFLPALLALLGASSLGAQQGTPPALAGYSPAAAARQRAAESAAVARPSPERAARLSRELSREPHVAGTPAQTRTRDYVVAQMKAMGLETEVRGYDVWMPHPTSVRVWRLSPDSVELRLAEGPVPGDSTTGAPEVLPINGTGAAGDASGEVVYVNYGLIEDYAQLDSAGVSVKGKVVLARYGRSFRGIKAREAERHGAIALLIYSDPRDDGYARGDVFPEGPMRPPQGIQRGSVFNGAGDPSTPGWPSTVGAKRVALGEMDVPHIPVVPISYGNAAKLLEGVRGGSLPGESWQGGLPFRYHVGPGPVRARVQVVTDASAAAAAAAAPSAAAGSGGREAARAAGFKRVWDTFGVVRGAEFPDEVVIVGAHRDAWGPGTADNVSGVVSVLEAARAVADEVKAGRRPRRTIVFATWDAEEWGLVGSSEYVEDDSLRLMRNGVAYLNQDVAAQGPAFGGGGSPSLRPTLRDVARLVPDPSGKGSVYDVWRARAAAEARGTSVADTAQPPMDDPGGGSDFAGFYNHLGVPIAEWGFGGPGGVYHSAYDDYAWMTKFGDPGFVHHAAAARVGAAMLLRLANADVVPFDYVEYARTMRRYLPGVAATFPRSAAWRDSAAAPLGAAIDRLERAAQEFAAARDGALAAGPLPKGAATATNAALRRVERALTRPEGLRTRPWYRNLIYAADENNGYANVVFPSVAEAARGGDEALARREAADLADRFDAATAALAEATRSVTVRGR